jgi:hypothetical protein
MVPLEKGAKRTMKAPRFIKCDAIKIETEPRQPQCPQAGILFSF